MPVPNTRKSRKLGNNRKHVPSPKKFNEIKSEVLRGIQRRGEGGRAAGRAISGRTDYGVTDRACEPQVPREGGPFFSPKLIERRRRRLPVKIGPLIRQKSSPPPPSLPPFLRAPRRSYFCVAYPKTQCSPYWLGRLLLAQRSLLYWTILRH